MELWLVFAVISSIFSGLAGFLLKIIAKKNESSELHSLYSAAWGILLIGPLAWYFSGTENIGRELILFSFLIGIIASISGIFKVYALRHIDTTIYFPLFKIVSPLIAIVWGITFFNEQFSSSEWTGLVLSLLIPLLLLTKTENSRQSNLYLGVLLILFTGTLSSLGAGLSKYIANFSKDILWIAFFSVTGVLIGSIILTLKKHGLAGSATLINETNKRTIIFGLLRTLTINISFLSLLYSFVLGGALGIVYTITSMYILIPIILAIVFYNEHWNTQKVLAVVLSIVALGFFA